jgi:predicted TIM-barrel fold metal-dependent hydrolase
MLQWIGAGRIMWAADYPHNEGSLGYGSLSKQAVLDSVSASDARQILGGTAIKVYGLQ